MGFEIRKQDGSFEGLHAVTILGINVEKPEKPWNIIATGIDKIYVHDDQVGPYARMEFLENGSLSTSWGDKCIAKPLFLSIPLTSKIRINFVQVKYVCLDLAKLFKTAFKYLDRENFFSDFTNFDFFLSSINEVKHFVLNETGIDDEERYNFLQRNLPKHIWRIIITVNENWFEIGIDATDIEQGDFFSYSITNSEIFKEYFELCSWIASVNRDKMDSNHTIEILSHIVKDI